MHCFHHYTGTQRNVGGSWSAVPVYPYQDQ